MKEKIGRIHFKKKLNYLPLFYKTVFFNVNLCLTKNSYTGICLKVGYQVWPFIAQVPRAVTQFAGCGGSAAEGRDCGTARTSC